jgi:hypothetical protein
MGRLRLWGAIILGCVTISLAQAQPAPSTSRPSGVPAPAVRIDDALRNITSLVRPGRVGYATAWDRNKYVQCRRQTDRSVRCEAAGTAMQPSLKNVLDGAHLNRLAALGWVLDPSFGNYVRTFPADMPTAQIAERILQTLTEAYAADLNDLEIATAWVADLPCPPRNGFSQNLAGMINDAPAMRGTAVRTCSYVTDPATPDRAASASELIGIYGPLVTAEIQRLRINASRKGVFASFNAGIGYIQCMQETPATMYCEAQSEESWSALTAILTPERRALLHKVGYVDPGRSPNYAKTYPYSSYDDAGLAREILTLLFEVYGYSGATKLKIITEEG